MAALRCAGDGAAQGLGQLGRVCEVGGAAYHVDSSWDVEYVVTTSAQSFYSWRVAADGTVIGGYWAPGSAPPPAPPSQQLGPLRWQQPARCGQ